LNSSICTGAGQLRDAFDVVHLDALPSSPSFFSPLPKSFCPPFHFSLPRHPQQHHLPLACAFHPWWLVMRRSSCSLALMPLCCRLRTRPRKRNRDCSPRFLPSIKHPPSSSSSSCFLRISDQQPGRRCCRWRHHYYTNSRRVIVCSTSLFGAAGKQKMLLQAI
jgi:hypothetical protein